MLLALTSTSPLFSVLQDLRHCKAVGDQLVLVDGDLIRLGLAAPAGHVDHARQRRFKAVPGVIDVTGWGGKSKAYEITIDQNKLISYGLTMTQVLQALNNGNINVGAQTVNFGTQSAVVRGIGLIHSMDDIRKTVLTSNNGTPVLVKDVAEVRVGNRPRLGIAGHEGDNDIVQGIVLMRRGEKSMPTIKAVEQEIEKINTTGILPPGVQIQKLYDRSDLINITTGTVLHNMLVGIVLIFLVQWLFLGNSASAIIVATTIPFALFFAILILVVRGEFSQSALRGSHRFRADRRCDGHHGGEHFPPSCRGETVSGR